MAAQRPIGRTLGLLSSLYFVQGLPFGFQATALPVYLREEGLSLTGIGFATALSAGYLVVLVPLQRSRGTSPRSLAVTG